MKRRSTAPKQIITKAIGYHAGEDRGSNILEKGRYRYRYFLKEWGWGQAACVEAIRLAELPIPVKSACYFCPSSKPHEILRLAKDHPDLYADAVAMEHQARPYHAEKGNVVKGLGRHWSWEQVVKAEADQFKMFTDPDELPCMCFDGEADEDPQTTPEVSQAPAGSKEDSESAAVKERGK